MADLDNPLETTRYGGYQHLNPPGTRIVRLAYQVRLSTLLHQLRQGTSNPHTKTACISTTLSF